MPTPPRRSCLLEPSLAPITAWQFCLKSYSACLLQYEKSATTKKGLSSADNWLRVALVDEVRSRSEGMFLNQSELSAVMKWKLRRGKWRPLQGKVDSNPNSLVIAATSEAFKFMDKGDISQAFKQLDRLCGVGPATATAILSPFYPDSIAFSSDQAMAAISSLVGMGTVQYTDKYILRFIAEIARLAKHLQLTAQEVETALFCEALGVLPPLSHVPLKPPEMEAGARLGKAKTSRVRTLSMPCADVTEAAETQINALVASRKRRAMSTKSPVATKTKRTRKG